ncbi:MAG TPA: lipid A biosynthesis acyltransferase [Geobacter sp.]|nr:lipid A biosynthesis acyltransferase [Geobacter sp.]
MKRIFWMVQAAGFYCLTLVPALMPAATINRLGSILGILISRILPKRRAIVMENMDHALPYLKGHALWTTPDRDVRLLAEETFQNLGRNLVEICRLYHGQGDRLIDRIDLRGREHFEAARSKGKGMIVFSGHCGNWELMALSLSRIFGDGVVVVKPQKNPYFNRMVERMRMSYNSRVIYKKGALRGILGALKKGDSVGILADQAATSEDGVLIDVMGRKAWASTGPVLIAQRSGAALVPVFIHREGDRHVLTIYPEHPVSGDMSEEGIRKETQALSRYVEDFVVAHPTQWYWVHRRWKRAGEAIA